MAYSFTGLKLSELSNGDQTFCQKNYEGLGGFRPGSECDKPLTTSSRKLATAAFCVKTWVPRPEKLVALFGLYVPKDYSIYTLHYWQSFKFTTGIILHSGMSDLAFMWHSWFHSPYDQPCMATLLVSIKSVWDASHNSPSTWSCSSTVPWKIKEGVKKWSKIYSRRWHKAFEV